uniref:Peptidase A2 domain-containing protein n=1 Tax=Globodera rostochiensis TaxID=31243 RepID=A0A914HNH6_GLORO
MKEFCVIILVAFFVTNLLDKAKSVQLEELPLQTFDELFVDEWLDKDDAEDLKTRRQQTLDKMSITKSTGRTPKLDKLNPIQLIRILFSQSLITLDKLNPIQLIRVLLSQKKFDQMKAELKRDGFKNSQNQIDKTVAKELGLSFTTIYNWKRELGQPEPNKYRHSKQKELMKRYYEIKDQNPKISDEKIAKMLKIVRSTLVRWKKYFKRQQFHPNSVDGHSVEENSAGANVQEIENSNLEIRRGGPCTHASRKKALYSTKVSFENRQSRLGRNDGVQNPMEHQGAIFLANPIVGQPGQNQIANQNETVVRQPVAGQNRALPRGVPAFQQNVNQQAQQQHGVGVNGAPRAQNVVFGNIGNAGNFVPFQFHPPVQPQFQTQAFAVPHQIQTGLAPQPWPTQRTAQEQQSEMLLELHRVTLSNQYASVIKDLPTLFVHILKDASRENARMMQRRLKNCQHFSLSNSPGESYTPVREPYQNSSPNYQSQQHQNYQPPGFNPGQNRGYQNRNYPIQGTGANTIPLNSGQKNSHMRSQTNSIVIGNPVGEKSETPTVKVSLVGQCELSECEKFFHVLATHASEFPSTNPAIPKTAECISVEVKVDENKAKALIDSGAETNVVNPAFLHKISSAEGKNLMEWGFNPNTGSTKIPFEVTSFTANSEDHSKYIIENIMENDNISLDCSDCEEEFEKVKQMSKEQEEHELVQLGILAGDKLSVHRSKSAPTKIDFSKLPIHQCGIVERMLVESDDEQLYGLEFNSVCSGEGEHSKCAPIQLGQIFCSLPDDDPIRRIRVETLGELISLQLAKDVLIGHVREWAGCENPSAADKLLKYKMLSQALEDVRAKKLYGKVRTVRSTFAFFGDGATEMLGEKLASEMVLGKNSTELANSISKLSFGKELKEILVAFGTSDLNEDIPLDQTKAALQKILFHLGKFSLALIKEFRSLAEVTRYGAEEEKRNVQADGKFKPCGVRETIKFLREVFGMSTPDKAFTLPKPVAKNVPSHSVEAQNYQFRILNFRRRGRDC